MPAGKMKKVYQGKKSIASLTKKVNQIAIQSKPENKQKFVKLFDAQVPAASYALTQSLATTRILSNLVAGVNNDNVVGTKIFLKNMHFRFYIRSGASPTAVYDPMVRVFIFKAGSGLATRGTPVIGDILVSPNGDNSDMNAMIDTKKVQMLYSKVIKPVWTTESGSGATHFVSTHNKTLKINKPFQWADTNATLTGATLGKSGDYYIGFIGQFSGAANQPLELNCECMINYTDA